MSSPFSDRTEWDPLGPTAPAGGALLILRPRNAEAKWAFSQVVDFIQEQSARDGSEEAARVRFHYAQFIWFSDEQIPDSAVTRYLNAQNKLESSPSSSSTSDSADEPVNIWTGFYFLDPSIAPLVKSSGWSMGRLSRKNLTLGQPTVDLLLTTDRTSPIHRKHALIHFSNDTRYACTSLDFGSLIVVNNYEITTSRRPMMCAEVENSISCANLQYILKYTPHSYREEGQAALRRHLIEIHGDNQPTREALLASPTPTPHCQKLGEYIITAAGAVGMGTYGRVRPATGPMRDSLVAIKSMEFKRGTKHLMSEKIDMMKELTRLSDLEKDDNTLKVVEIIHMLGGLVEEYHIVLEPFVDITMTRVSRRTHHTKLEMILQGCLNGLAFLHRHRMVHTDIKPPNIGLKNFFLETAAVEADASAIPGLRPLRVVLLDIDSIATIPSGHDIISARPGSNGTLGFHSPEHETTGYDGRTDVWALGVSFYKVTFGQIPWPSTTRNNPWRSDNVYQVEARRAFHSQYKDAIANIHSHWQAFGETLHDFLLASLRFPDATIESQAKPRPTSEECLHLIMQKSRFLQAQVSKRGGDQPLSAREDVTEDRKHKRRG